MKRVGQYILKSIILGLAHIPLSVLYILADFIALLLYHIIRYRRKLVLKNIALSFPEMTPQQVRHTAKQFYTNFADYIVETLRLAAIPAHKLHPRMTFENLSLILRYLNSGRPVVAYFSHCFNWEWVTLMGEFARGNDKIAFAEVYRPLKNKFFDKLLLNIRTRFNTQCFPKTTVFRQLLKLHSLGIATCTGFMSDQKPSHGDRVHIVKFLNRPTAVITGTETVARKLNAPAVYLDMTKISRGHYHIRVIPLSDDVSITPDFLVTDKYFQLLEQNIRRQPDIWLWSHNRWKYPVSFPEP